MNRHDEEKKGIRVEYKILGFVIIFILLVTGYRFIKEYFEEHSFEKKGSFAKEQQLEKQSPKGTQSKDDEKSQEKANTISEAISQEKPIILDMSNNPLVSVPEYNAFIMENPDVVNIEKATEVDNPTIWIYMNNDGFDKSEEAMKYCQSLHQKGVKALRVEIYDAKQRARGKIVQIGEYRCF